MAFDYTNLYPDTSGNGGYTKSWNYTTVTDSIATCSASGYFNKVASRLGIGDNIVIARVDAFPTSARTTLVEYATLYVNGISGGVVTTLPSTTGYATTAYVDAADALRSPIASPTFTGTPAAPTAAPGTNTTQLATTAFTVAEILARVASLDVAVYKGVIDCSANPNYPAADAGNTYRVSVAGKIGGASGLNVEVGDMMMCLTDGTASGTQAAVGANWDIIQANIDGAVVGPASATSGRVATFNGTTGKIIQDGGIAISAGQYPGQPSTGSASAGNIGEFVSQNVPFASAVSITTTATAQNILTLAIPSGGDWDVTGLIGFVPAATTNVVSLVGSISLVTGTLDTSSDRFVTQNQSASGIVYNSGSRPSIALPVTRISVASATSVYLVAFAQFTVSTITGFGILRARRAD